MGGTIQKVKVNIFDRTRTVGDYYVTNHKVIPRIKQTAQNCWLYAAVMLSSWKFGRNIPPDEEIALWQGDFGFMKRTKKFERDDLRYTKDWFKEHANVTREGDYGLSLEYFERDAQFGDILLTSRLNVSEVTLWFNGCRFRTILPFCWDEYQKSGTQNLVSIINEKVDDIDWHKMLEEYGPLLLIRGFPGHAIILIGTWAYTRSSEYQFIIIDPAIGLELRLLWAHFKEYVESYFKQFGSWENCIWVASQ